MKESIKVTVKNPNYRYEFIYHGLSEKTALRYAYEEACQEGYCDTYKEFVKDCTISFVKTDNTIHF